MGATNCPETPRQKMITMMYLVYTAMLALNVSAEVIQGFKSVGTALHESNKNLEFKLKDSYDGNVSSVVRSTNVSIQESNGDSAKTESGNGGAKFTTGLSHRFAWAYSCFFHGYCSDKLVKIRRPKIICRIANSFLWINNIIAKKISLTRAVRGVRN